MVGLEEQQAHLKDVFEQQNRISIEINQLQSTLESKRLMMNKLQGVAEYLDQIGVQVPESEEDVVEEEANSAPTE